MGFWETSPGSADGVGAAAYECERPKTEFLGENSCLRALNESVGGLGIASRIGV